ncbi:hypothetical protein RJ641_009412 [Dillenia turbinata]|uniref:Glycosyltransferase N-terminal domain-containing protein n=1 Tax=Dillenia turbinata TaxID=194707 RepID=A0AAN8V7U5_9MAGN
MGVQRHVLFVPIPAQGHVAPLMKLAQQIADYDIKVTFVNTEFIHNKIISSLPENYYDENRRQRLKLVSVPDGLGPEDNRTDFLKLTDSMLRVTPGYLKDLIDQSNRIGEGEEITCLIGDLSVGWAFKIAEEMGIMRAALLPCASAALALTLQVPKLIETGIIDTNGTTLKNELIHLSKGMPSWSSYELIWSCQNDLATQKVFFDYTADTHKTMEIVNWILCNSSYEIDQPAFDLVPNVLPIGPLLASKHTNGIIGRQEIKDKIKKLLSDDGIRETSLKLMEVARKSVSQGGSSKRNLEYFIEQIKG